MIPGSEKLIRRKGKKNAVKVVQTVSAATKRKHVVKEVLNDFVLPEGSQKIVRLIAGRGNNLHEVESDDEEKFLVSMPTKFRKNVWIKRGDFVIVAPISEGDKVKAEILTILYKEQIKYIQQEGKWPSGFRDYVNGKGDHSMISADMLPPSDSDSDCKPLGDRVVNQNRPPILERNSGGTS